MTRIAVLVSGGGTNLQALIDAEKRGELGEGKISLVIATIKNRIFGKLFSIFIIELVVTPIIKRLLLSLAPSVITTIVFGRLCINIPASPLNR